MMNPNTQPECGRVTDADRLWMARALELAEHGRGHVEPNPLVGAVVVSEGRVVGEGWHQKYGQAHAEVNALADAGDDARGGTLYVTLEPCCHHGKTPPCTDAVLRSGVRRVVAAMTDPFPEVGGKGVELLRKVGLEVVVGVGEAEARRLNAPYLKLLAANRPYVHAKWAMTLDGKIATRAGDSRWISNETSRRRVHELRGRMDAIVVGSGTVRADDPLLTARPAGPRNAVRVVMATQADLPSGCQLLQTACQVPLLVAAAKPIPDDRWDALRLTGAEVFGLATNPEGRPDVAALLRELGRRRMTNVLVEGGAGVLGSFLDARLIDEVHVFIAPRLAGGVGASSPLGGLGVEKMAQSLGLADVRVETIDGDVLIHGRVASPAEPGTNGTHS